MNLAGTFDRRRTPQGETANTSWLGATDITKTVIKMPVLQPSAEICCFRAKKVTTESFAEKAEKLHQRKKLQLRVLPE